MNKERVIIRFNAPVILSVALLSLIAMFLDMWTEGYTTTLLFSVYASPLDSFWTYPRFIFHIFGHSGWNHYIGNMLLLLLVGPLCEEKYGHKSTFYCIIITAIITGLVHFIIFPGTAMMGCSGVVFMFIVLSSFTEMRKEGIPITLILIIILYLGGELWTGLTSSDNVSQLSHIVGGICGLVIGFTIKTRSHGRR